MTNMTFEEWTARLLVFETETHDPPRLVASMNGTHGLHVKADSVTGAVELRGSRDHARRSCMVPHVTVTGGPAAGGSLSRVEAIVSDYRRVLDALHRLAALTEGMRVWLVGDCPCDYCSERGDHNGTPCKRCNGEGKR